MNKTSKVTLWIEPTSHQILKYTFDDLGWNFFPGQWLVRVSNVDRVDDDGPAVSGRVAAARPRDGRRADAGHRPVDLRYTLDYHDYRQPDVTSDVIVAKSRPSRR